MPSIVEERMFAGCPECDSRVDVSEIDSKKASVTCEACNISFKAQEANLQERFIECEDCDEIINVDNLEKIGDQFCCPLCHTGFDSSEVLNPIY